MNILVVEDDPKLGKFICESLRSDRHAVKYCPSISEVLERRLFLMNDLIVLDLVLGEESGRDLVMALRKEVNNIPILVLSGVLEPQSKIDLLQLGADDYMTKPFDREELVARVNALYRRYLDAPMQRLQVINDVIFDWKERKILFADGEVHLSQRELQFVRLLVLNRGSVVRSRDILRKVWNVGPGYHSNVLQSLVRRLRKRFNNGFGTTLIKNVHGVGYMICL